MSSNEPHAGSMIGTRYRAAVLVPCYNEERAIAKVVADFRAALPEAAVYVYDNNSTDGTVAAAKAAGAVVRRETYQGKGHVVRRMFNDVQADVYVLVDGDATYDAPSAPAMIAKLIEERLDMVVATRVDRDEAAYRPGHRAGNRLLTGFITHMGLRLAITTSCIILLRLASGTRRHWRRSCSFKRIGSNRAGFAKRAIGHRSPQHQFFFKSPLLRRPTEVLHAA